MKKINSLITTLLLISICFLNGCSISISNSKNLDTFTNLTQLKEFLTTNNDYLYDCVEEVTDALSAAPIGKEEVEEDYSKTNTQHKDVDEGDIIKTDGKYIYFLSYMGLQIIQVNKGEMELVYKEDYTDFMPIELYVFDHKAIIVGGTYTRLYDNIMIAPGFTNCYYYSYYKTEIRFYDFEDISNPELIQKLTIDGSYNTSRIVDNTFYYFINHYIYIYNETIDLPDITDNLKNNGKAEEININKIYYLREQNYYNNNLTIAGSINLLNGKSDYRCYLGINGDLYISPLNLYLVFTIYEYEKEEENDWSYYKINTVILKISLNGFKDRGYVKIDGFAKDRYSLDEYEGFLRVVTTVSYWDKNSRHQYTNLFIFNDAMTLISNITNIAPGESVYSVRFNGTTGSIVTFLQVDPLFTLDLSNPYKPTISQGYKEDGVSYYLHYIEGTNYIIGVGRDSGIGPYNNVIWKGLKVTLYDNSGDDVVAVNTIYIGNANSYAELLYNPKALLYDQERDIFAFTAESWYYQSDNYNYYCQEQGLYIFGFMNGELIQKAVLSDINNGDAKNWNSFYYSAIKRGIRIGDYIYTISESYITSYSLEDFILNNKIALR